MVTKPRMSKGSHMAYMEARNIYEVSVQKPEGKRSLGRPKHRSDIKNGS
jgi:hypothetical protein